MMKATVEASPNMALTKYWGKRDQKLILPTNSSISVAFGEKVRTRTTVMFSPHFKDDILTVNGREIKGSDFLKAPDFRVPLDKMREMANVDFKCHIASVNTFPTASGFASSAAGLAAFSIASCKALGLKLTLAEISKFARLGSGSATRSVMGGFVKWEKGEKTDGSDSIARQIATADFWPEFRLVSGVVTREKKKISSRTGMQQTINTSTLFSERLKNAERLNKELEDAILSKDILKVFEITMHDTLNMHACMMDTWPPIMYLNDTSRDAIYEILKYNETDIRAGYTFDAGPNIHVVTTKDFEEDIKTILSNIKGVQAVHSSGVGNGPSVIEDEKFSLIDDDGNIVPHRADFDTWEILME